MSYLKLMAKTVARQRSRHREFRFRFSPPRRGLYRVGVRARRGEFRAQVGLRPGTSDVRTFEQIFLQDFYNLASLERWPEMQAAYARRAERAQPVILDLGANVGLASLYLAKLFPGARLLAVEPSADNCRQMRHNLAGLPRAEVILGAVASADGAVRIVNPEGPSAGYRTEAAAPGAADAVAAYAVESLLKMAGGGRPALPWLAKVDIEGFEADLFARNLEWVDRFPVLIVEPHDWALPKQGRAANFLRAIAPLERDFLLLGESVVSLARHLDR